MKSKLKISFAGHLSDRLRPLYDGTVEPEGIELVYLPTQPYEAFPRMINGEFDCSELSFSSYVLMVSRGDCPFVALPVFPSRTFRHSAIYVSSASGILAPADLRGKRIGVPEYTSTAIVWARGMLRDEYGFEPSQARWITGGLTKAGRIQKFKPQISGVDISHNPDRTLDEMLLSGDLDAIIAPQAPPAFRNEDPKIGRLFPNYVEVEQAYFRKTGIFPIMHVVAMKRELVERHPWAAVSLYRAFLAAKDMALRELEIDEPLSVSMPWSFEYAKSIKSMMGGDMWPYGVEKNRRAIEALCRYSCDQGLSERRVEVEELFPSHVIGSDRYKL